MSELCFGEEDLANLREVIESQELWRGTEGNFVRRFEDGFADHLGRTYVHALASGTAANETALAGLGLEPGDEVICPATAPIFVSLPVVSLGCIPVFADTDPRTLIITPEGIEQRITPKTRAVVVVHLFGQPAPMDEILTVARKHGLKVVEDCAQAYDCYYKGRMAGTLGDVTCFSLQQSKHLASGEGGMIATDDPEIYKRAVLYANVGMPWYRHELEKPVAEPLAGLRTRGHFAFGHNYRMSELQGAVAFAQLGKIDAHNTQRRQWVELVENELRDQPEVELAYVYPDTQPNYWMYPLRVPPAAASYSEINYLEVVYQEMQRTRRTSVGFPLPDYVQYEPGSCPNAEAASQRFRTVNVGAMTDEPTLREAIDAVREAVQQATT